MTREDAFRPRPCFVLEPGDGKSRSALSQTVITADCGHQCVVGSTGHKFINEQSPATICLDCLIDAPPAAPPQVYSAPGALDEIEAAGEDPERVRQIMNELGIKEL